MASDDLETLARLRGLLDVSRVVRDDDSLPHVLSAIARTIAESLGYKAVVVNLYRPAWDDFEVTTVHDSDASSVEQLLGTRGGWKEWAPLLDERFRRRGAYFVRAGEHDWSGDMLVVTPDIPISDDPDAWHPEDALFVPLTRSDGHLLGILSVDEPASGMRPQDADLEVLVALAEHVSLALESAQEAARSARYRRALERLLQISSRLTETLSIDAVLQSVAEGIADALGYAKVSIDLPSPETGVLTPRCAVGWSLADMAANAPLTMEMVRPLLDPELEIEGCYLLTAEQAMERLPARHHAYESVFNGSGPHAWNHHWLIVPLSDREGELIGVIWVDDPVDRLLPSHDLLQALRVFANQATAALDSATHFEEMRFLAEHDPLTRLHNRRAFTRRLAVETARSGRYHRPFALVTCDLDGFKALNDRHGHLTGDMALERMGTMLSEALRETDAAFRIGGDEFALLLPETDEAEVRAVIDRIATGLTDGADARFDRLQASFGVAVYPRDGEDPEGLFRAADEAMYAAKRSGQRAHFAA
ncbi:MAG TPA: diguanylate cyclase [Gaiellales bacterium]|jgi:diguanylate cyclase (GGDEF)-like protein